MSDPSVTVAGQAAWEQTSGAPYAYEVLDVRRFEVRKGDVWPIDAAAGNTANRAEIAQKATIPNGAPIKLSYRFLVECGDPNTDVLNCVVGQFHQQNGCSGSPPLFFNLYNETIQLKVCSIVSGANSYPIVWSATLVRGVWHSVSIAVTFSPAGGGSAIVTFDGVEIFNYSGPLGLVGQTAVYWKEGIYRQSQWQGSVRLYLAANTMAVNYANLSLTSP